MMRKAATTGICTCTLNVLLSLLHRQCLLVVLLIPPHLSAGFDFTPTAHHGISIRNKPTTAFTAFISSWHPSSCVGTKSNSRSELYSTSASSNAGCSASTSQKSRTSAPSKQLPVQVLVSPRTIAAMALIQTKPKQHKRKRKDNNQNRKLKQSNNDSPVTKLESSHEFQNHLSQRDKAFCRNIVSTTTRRRGQIDKVLEIVCNAKYPPKCGNTYSGIVTACLQMGTAQILFMDGIKDFAAVKETVNVLKYYNSGSKSATSTASTSASAQTPEKLVKFLNAILRRIVRDGETILREQTVCTDNISPWLLNEWNDAYGEDTTIKIVQQLLDVNSHSHVDLSLNIKPPPFALSQKSVHNDDDDDDDDDEFDNNETTGTSTEHEHEHHQEIQDIIHEFEKKGDNHGSITLLPNNSLRIKKGTETIVSNYPLYEEGKWWVQDVSSTLPAIGLISAFQQRFHDSHDNVSGSSGSDYSNYFGQLHIVDMCAAPGGKTSQLLAAGFGKVTAIEVNKRRSRRLKENLDRLKLRDRCKVVVSDGQDWVPAQDENENKVAGILLDVPCSATGTGNRRPDVLQKDTDDLESLLEIQEILANHCVDNCLSKGGIMVYATCSLLKSESEEQVMRLVQRGGVEILPFTRGEIPGFDGAIDDNGFLRVLPGVLGGELNYCDGFFAARLIKMI